MQIHTHTHLTPSRHQSITFLKFLLSSLLSNSLPIKEKKLKGGFLCWHHPSMLPIRTWRVAKRETHHRLPAFQTPCTFRSYNIASDGQESLKEIESLGKAQESVILFSDLNFYYPESSVKSSSSPKVEFLFLYIEMELVKSDWQVQVKLWVWAGGIYSVTESKLIRNSWNSGELQRPRTYFSVLIINHKTENKLMYWH